MLGTLLAYSVSSVGIANVPWHISDTNVRALFCFYSDVFFYLKLSKYR